MSEQDKNDILDKIHAQIKLTNDQEKIDELNDLYQHTIKTWLSTNPPVSN